MTNVCLHLPILLTKENRGWNRSDKENAPRHRGVNAVNWGGRRPFDILELEKAQARGILLFVKCCHASLCVLR